MHTLDHTHSLDDLFNNVRDIEHTRTKADVCGALYMWGQNCAAFKFSFKHLQHSTIKDHRRDSQSSVVLLAS